MAPNAKGVESYLSLSVGRAVLRDYLDCRILPAATRLGRVAQFWVGGANLKVMDAIGHGGHSFVKVRRIIENNRGQATFIY